MDRLPSGLGLGKVLRLQLLSRMAGSISLINEDSRAHFGPRNEEMQRSLYGHGSGVQAIVCQHVTGSMMVTNSTWKVRKRNGLLFENSCFPGL